MTAVSRHLFCFGLGYCASALATGLIADGWRVSGTGRDEDAQAALRARGFGAHVFERGLPLADAAAALSGCTHILSSIPPDGDGDPVLDLHGPDIARLGGLDWVGYLSTTGVYGDRAGGWVDENSAREPTGARGRRRVAAEDGWLALGRSHAIPVHLFRLAGIYGPGRNAIRTVLDGRARRIHKPGQVFSRIHVDDIAAVLRASIARPNPGAAYNLADDEAAAPELVIAAACELLGRPPPPLEDFEEAELSDMARSFYRDNKRVRNDRIKRELGVKLRWPRFRPALEALLKIETG